MNFRRYIEYKAGTLPLVFSCPHGGYKKPFNIPDKLKGDKIPDANMLLITKMILKKLEQFNIRPYHVISKIHRSKVDFNRPPPSRSAFYKDSAQAQEIHAYYLNKLEQYTQECLSKYQKCIIVDLHGFTKPMEDYPDIIFGNVFGNSLQIYLNSATERSREYWIFTELTKKLSIHFSLDDGLALDDYNVSYSGGYILYHFFRKKSINAFQLELSKEIRFNRELLLTFLTSFISVINGNLGE